MLFSLSLYSALASGFGLSKNRFSFFIRFYELPAQGPAAKGMAPPHGLILDHPDRLFHNDSSGSNRASVVPNNYSFIAGSDSHSC